MAEMNKIKRNINSIVSLTEEELLTFSSAFEQRTLNKNEFFLEEGDLKRTIKIGVLSGWDSDNPTATWGGLIGFMIGKDGIEKTFDRQFSNRFNIHRTRQNFPDDGIDTFENMAQKRVIVTDRVVKEQIGGTIDLEKKHMDYPIKEVE